MGLNLGNYSDQLSIGDYNQALSNSGYSDRLPDTQQAVQTSAPDMSGGNAFNAAASVASGGAQTAGATQSSPGKVAPQTSGSVAPPSTAPQQPRQESGGKKASSIVGGLLHGKDGGGLDLGGVMKIVGMFM